MRNKLERLVNRITRSKRLKNLTEVYKRNVYSVSWKDFDYLLYLRFILSHTEVREVFCNMKKDIKEWNRIKEMVDDFLEKVSISN